MEDKTYGWTVEMQLKFKTKMTYKEIPCVTKTESGFKVSGTIKAPSWPE
jgi:hypothetical protein